MRKRAQLTSARHVRFYDVSGMPAVEMHKGHGQTFEPKEMEINVRDDDLITIWVRGKGAGRIAAFSNVGELPALQAAPDWIQEVLTENFPKWREPV